MHAISFLAVALLAHVGVKAMPITNPSGINTRGPRSMVGTPYLGKRQAWLNGNPDNTKLPSMSPYGDGRKNEIPGTGKREEGHSRRKRQGWLYSSPNTDLDDHDRHNDIPGTG
ncbi:hypothetical protein P154DRAFT_625674 [Amniculicola lignicola CBS 123094]|uniref:Uncharacterized protein n=1 Tax=Amniculicola lignicola CBS 123094 TaxID=1392246 RepID=A0A6A5VZ37_9PLEO|nr:hypothetical protein P154DRAFT_625674 [Amniculicola lignicola CBS 123094]